MQHVHTLASTVNTSFPQTRPFGIHAFNKQHLRIRPYSVQAECKISHGPARQTIAQGDRGLVDRARALSRPECLPCVSRRSKRIWPANTAALRVLHHEALSKGRRPPLAQTLPEKVRSRREPSIPQADPSLIKRLQPGTCQRPIRGCNRPAGASVISHQLERRVSAQDASPRHVGKQEPTRLKFHVIDGRAFFFPQPCGVYCIVCTLAFAGQTWLGERGSDRSATTMVVAPRSAVNSVLLGS